MRTYTIYGLRIISDLPLPGVPEIPDGAVDLSVHNRGVLPRTGAPPGSAMAVDWRKIDQGWRLCYHTGTDELLEFVFDPEASHVDIRCTLPERVGDIAAVLLGPALAAVLYLRACLVLHASAVVVDGKAILLAGVSGAGKSTLTAALVAQGASFLAEDVSVLKFHAERFQVQPGSARLHLCPDASAVVGRTPEDLSRVFSPQNPDDKRWIDASTLSGGFHATQAPLRVIYLLVPRSHTQSAPDIVPWPAHRAGLALLDHLYGARWLRIPRALALRACADLASHAPVRLVQAPQGLEKVPITAEAILQDAGRAAAVMPRTA